MYHVNTFHPYENPALFCNCPSEHPPLTHDEQIDFIEGHYVFFDWTTHEDRWFNTREEALSALMELEHAQ